MENSIVIKKRKKNSQRREVWDRLKQHPIAMIALAGCLFIIFIGVFADVIVPYSMAINNEAMEKLLPAFSPGHIFGTDNFGRDIFARIIHGTRTALIIGMVSTIISIVISTILASVAAMSGRAADNIIMRIIDVLSCIPGTVLALAICASLGNGIPQLVIAISISGIPMHTKMIRSVSLTVANKEYIEAAMILGAKQGYIIRRHLVPNLASIILINGTTQVSINIMQGATLGFIGLGVKAPTPEWGTMLSEGLNYMIGYPHMVLIPGIALCLAAFFINTLGDSLRDAFDPQLKGKA